MLFCASVQAKPEDTLDLCRLLNDDLAATVKKHPKRFAAFGTLPMQAPELAIRELERCVKVCVQGYWSIVMLCVQELGFPGVQIGSHINDWNLDAPELINFFAVCSDEYSVILSVWVCSGSRRAPSCYICSSLGHAD